jgi:hypothetical protein
MAFKKRKDPNGGLTKLAKFERQQSIINNPSPKMGETIQSIGGPISSVEDIKRTFEHYRTTQQIELEKGIEDQMIGEYILDSSDKQHLVFNCKKVIGGYHWFASFVSDNQVLDMQRSKDKFEEINN